MNPDQISMSGPDVKTFLMSSHLQDVIQNLSKIPSTNLLSIDGRNQSSLYLQQARQSFEQGLSEQYQQDKSLRPAQLRDKFMHYHNNRNYFNKRTAGITKLTKTQAGLFKDDQNIGTQWREVGFWGNIFHMPKLAGAKAYFWDNKLLSRKFLLADNESGVGGEYEIIVRHDGVRITSDVSKDHQETYNFGRTTEKSLHTLYDVTPHLFSGEYKKHYDVQSKITIEE